MAIYKICLPSRLEPSALCLVEGVESTIKPDVTYNPKTKSCIAEPAGMA